MRKLLLALLIGLALIIVISVLVGFGGHFLKNSSNTATPTPIATQVQPNSPIFSKLNSWLPGDWSTPVTSSQMNYSGMESSVTITTQTAAVSHFEDVSYLKSLGFEPDINLSADGPGSSVWGYKNAETGQVIVFSYRTSPTSTNPNEPLQFNCPCQSKVSVFVSNVPAGS